MQEISIRRFSRSDQKAVESMFQEGLLSYTSADGDIQKIQQSFVDMKLSTSGDMYDIYESYKISTSEEEVDRNFWVAVIDDEVIGCVAAIPSTLYPGQAVELLRMSVHREYRRKGVASKLISHLSKWALSKNIKKIHLDTLSAMENAILFYQSNGFVITHEGILDVSDRFLDLNSNHTNLTYMIKFLDD